jgi:hypothetical protein
MKISDKTIDKIISAIISDIADRSGLGDEWDQIDSNIKNEIIKEWKEIIKYFIEKEKE